jgi:cell wall-associated NlpC family hydrolase
MASAIPGGPRGDGKRGYSDATYDIIVEAAYSRLGCPYIWAAAGPDSFDCSGLTQWCYNKAGIRISHYDVYQRDEARSLVPVSEALPGDILWKAGHVGLYIGDGSYIHAPTPGDVVRIQSNMAQWICACRF